MWRKLRWDLPSHLIMLSRGEGKLIAPRIKPQQFWISSRLQTDVGLSLISQQFFWDRNIKFIHCLVVSCSPDPLQEDVNPTKHLNVWSDFEAKIHPKNDQKSNKKQCFFYQCVGKFLNQSCDNLWPCRSLIFVLSSRRRANFHKNASSENH